MCDTVSCLLLPVSCGVVYLTGSSNQASYILFFSRATMSSVSLSCYTDAGLALVGAQFLVLY